MSNDFHSQWIAVATGKEFFCESAVIYLLPITMKKVASYYVLVLYSMLSILKPETFENKFKKVKWFSIPIHFFLLQILLPNPTSMSFSVQSCCVDSPPEPREISTKLFIHSYYTRAELSTMVMLMVMAMLMVMVQSCLFTRTLAATNGKGVCDEIWQSCKTAAFPPNCKTSKANDTYMYLKTCFLSLKRAIEMW